MLLAAVCLTGALSACTKKSVEAPTEKAEATQSQTVSEQEYDYLVLVNKENKLPDDWEANVILEDAQNDMTGIEMNADNSYLATDVFKVETKTLEAFKQLQAACAKDGITGYSYEPRHFRYVGVDAAKEIMEKKLTLEEYLA